MPKKPLESLIIAKAWWRSIVTESWYHSIARKIAVKNPFRNFRCFAPLQGQRIGGFARRLRG
jgi:hypothetical protein